MVDAVGTRTFAYHTSGTRQHEDFSAGSLYHASVVKRLGSAYTDQIFINAGGGVFNIFTFPRLSAVTFGTTGSPSADYSAAYHYDDDSDWMNKVTGPGLPSGGANYTYATDSSLVSKTQFKTGGKKMVVGLSISDWSHWQSRRAGMRPPGETALCRGCCRWPAMRPFLDESCAIHGSASLVSGRSCACVVHFPGGVGVESRNVPRIRCNPHPGRSRRRRPVGRGETAAACL